ncbi:DEAD/DEAH box helicase family protein [Thiopseudomonas alkaliphila]|uniref:DEAD/DEAH box helicase family protein n=1 Tax=Thiopseudomonas alkaliphila TaxID=1697053 RepID=UPI002578E7A8|nr:DEAD/DEAH box helicase family protein [Thiopseudomonas alkaliphila]MDM1717440.1 DEAD/DEAH box helicase family protein [Thiopseudomonas alkaliphila]
MAKKPINKDLLFNQFKEFDRLGLFSENYEVPNYVKDNLKDQLRPYQDEALRYLHYAQNNQEADVRYKHLLFNMATGAGKTMVMAGAILYMFKEYGYQNFIFFVHTDAIIQKTKENLLNASSSKYLFSKQLEIEGEKIAIESVETFPATPSKNTIYLKLSTIHKIHDELNNPKENSITLSELKEQRLVLLGDEAHHFNAETKAKGKAKNTIEYEELTWEKTISSILALQPANRLFEFTATINLDNKDIFQKYKDKIIYQYDLKQFMMDGFSKKVMLLEADQEDNDKMLDAVLLSQYRKLVALDHGIHGFKPIILFKSNQIAVSKAKQHEFSQIIESLTPNLIDTHLTQKRTQLSSSTSIWHKVIDRYSKGSLVAIVRAIKDDFNNMNILNVNKSDLLEEHPILLNTLEETNNPIRAIFAVAKVNEGWDVLNLYDIVRISEKASKTKTGTDSEAQLIGRGARYYPFSYQNQQSYTRRFDTSVSSLAILEQLHYHTINEPSYVKVLHDSLDNSNILANMDGLGKVEHAKLKEDFKKTKIYQTGELFYNEVVEVDNKSRTWESYSLEIHFDISYKTAKEISLENIEANNAEMTHIETLKLDQRYYLKALQKNSFFTFESLQIYFPMLNSITEFITSANYLGGLTIDVKLPHEITLNELLAKEKLQLLESVLARIADNIRRNFNKVRGTYRFTSKPLKTFIQDYSTFIDMNPATYINQRIDAKSTIGKKWYVFDQAILNQLEHRLVALFEQFIDKLKNKYDDIYLIRNDEQSSGFKLREFNGVRGFMPDFILIMTGKGDDAYYQVFLEPKGDDRLLDEAWKEKMLAAINNKDLIILDSNDDIRLVGIKFFSDSKRYEFIKDFEDKLYDSKPLEERSLI